MPPLETPLRTPPRTDLRRLQNWRTGVLVEVVQAVAVRERERRFFAFSIGKQIRKICGKKSQGWRVGKAWKQLQICKRTGQ